MQHRRLVLAVIILLSIGSAFAQSANSTTGGISGVITESSGTPLPGVTVTATNTATGLNRSTVTEAAGDYVFALLPPGRYRVEGELAGLGKVVSPDVTVVLGNTTRIDLKLSPQVTETITVTAAAPVVDVRQTGLAASVSEDQIENLPLLGRDFRDLAQLTPGVSTTFGDRIAFNGARGITTDLNIDGADNNSDFFGEQRGGTRAPFTFSQASIQEFQVIRSAFSAEYSKGVGGTLNAITKSGTNDFKGQVFYYMRSADWASDRSTRLEGLPVSDSFLAKDVDQFGGAVGGPIIRDRLHYFGTVDIQDFTRNVTAFDIRTDPDFVALPEATRSEFVLRVEQAIGHSLDDDFTFGTTEDQETYLLKLDTNIGTKHHLSVRDNMSKFTNFASEGTNPLSNQGVFENNFNSIVAQGESVLTNSLFNQLIAQYSNEERPRNPITTGVPHTTLEGSVPYNFGQTDFLPNDLKETRLQFKDSLSYNWGNHLFKAGFEVMNTELDNLFPRDFSGQYFFASIPNFLSGTVRQFQQGLGPEGLEMGNNVFDYRYSGVFVHDTWKISNLTLDLGVRYDHQTMPKPIRNVAPKYPEFVDNFQSDDDNFAPRLGFAWDIANNGRSVVRGGVGKYYQFLPSILLADPLAQIAGIFTTISVTCSATNPCPTYPNLLNREEFNRFARSSTNIRTVSADLEAQESLRTIIGFEQQLGQSYSVGIEGTYSDFSKQQGQININAMPTGVVFGNLRQFNVTNPNRPYPEFQDVTQHVSDAEASYKALTVSTRKMALANSKISWLAHYTWSEAIDQDSNERSTSTSFRLDPFDPKLSEGRADYDITHKVVLAGTYEAPFGINLSGIANFRSGQPWTPSVSGINNGLGSQSVFTPVLVRNGEVVDMTAATGMNIAELQTFLSGAVVQDRNQERFSNVFSVDMRVGKRFNFVGDLGVELLVEVFNLLNTENTEVPGANRTLYSGTLNNTTQRYTFTRNANFGKESAFAFGTDPRQFQVALKVHF